ncbi:MAG: SCO family protein [Candidatus Kapabacteria bacterium]|nr:SCO family protein [Candidatus Kapabacteria bacterium]
MNHKYTLILLLALTMAATAILAAPTNTPKVGIEEHLGASIPLDLKFINSAGDTVLLGQLIDKPTLLSFVYFKCSGICGPLSNALADGIAKLKMKAGSDYQVISVCFDPRETTADAAKWKKDYVEVISDKFPQNAWHVLRGDSANVKKLSDAIGFYYKNDGHDGFIHAGSIFAISSTGLISRYLNFDQNYNPFDLKMALLEADQNQSNPTIRTVLQYCFSYDPMGKRYVFNTTRVIAAFMLIAVGGLFTFLLIKGKKDRQNKLTEGILHD